MDCSPSSNIFVEGAALTCSSCADKLCMRQQVINLALGQTEKMLCLACLSKETGRSKEEIIENIYSYIDSRDCFKKSWLRYPELSYCPNPTSCVPNVCFQLNKSRSL